MSAAPGREETTARIGYGRDHSKPRQAQAGNPGWVELASPTPASHGREYIMVSASAGTFSQIRLTASSGRPDIRSVRVDFQDGSRKVFEVRRVLDARRSPVYLDLRGPHEIKQIIVVTDRRSSGSYVLEGNTSDDVASR